MAVAKFPRSIPDIFVDVVNQFTILVRKEAQLARVEMSEKASRGRLRDPYSSALANELLHRKEWRDFAWRPPNYRLLA